MKNFPVILTERQVGDMAREAAKAGVDFSLEEVDQKPATHKLTVAGATFLIAMDRGFSTSSSSHTGQNEAPPNVSS